MHKKETTPTAHSLRAQYLKMEIKNNSRSWEPVHRNGWLIKFSVYKDSNILLVFVSRYTAQTIVRYFSEEDDACNFINYIVAHDAKEYLEQHGSEE